MLRFPSLFAILALLPYQLSSEPLGLGRIALPEEIAAWDTDIRPDGTGLPQGAGSAAEGETIFAEKCAHCHGDFGEGVDRWPVLAGGQGSLTDARPLKTLGSYWPYLSTAYDYIFRSMPYDEPSSLSPDETYAITAYLLLVNDLIEDEDFTLTHDNFASIKLPNEENFRLDDRPKTEYREFRDACMHDCKTSVGITQYATGKDVTPKE